MSVQRSRMAGLAAAGASRAGQFLRRALDSLPGAAREAQVAELRANLGRVVAEHRAALAQRDLLLCEVNHRVKNNLQLLDGLVVLRGRSVEDAAARRALGAVRDDLFTLGLAHRRLMESPDLRTLDLGPYLEDLAHELLGRDAPGVRLKVRAKPLCADLEVAVPLGLLFAELIASARAHARRDGQGSIEADLALAGPRRIRLQVVDDGWVPEPPAPARRMPADIVEALLRQLGATLTVTVDHRVCRQVEMYGPALP